jgi:DNA-binding CsgD family transcriptional regulator
MELAHSVSSLDHADAAIVGRDYELEILERWLARPGPTLLEIEGDAGIGKSALWDEALRRARESGALCLTSRPAEIETAVSYGGLASIVEHPLELVGDEVPAPRRRALEGALRLRDVAASSLDEAAVALGAASVLRQTARQRPLVVAVDDVQWLDSSSRVALTYALRSLQQGDAVHVLLTRRLGSDAALELTGAPLSLAAEALRPAPLSAGALHRLISRRLAVTLSRPKLVRIHAASRGNPFHALALAQAIADTSSHDVTLALPASLALALRARIDGLSRGTQELLLAVAASGDADLELLERLLGAEAVGVALPEALEREVVVLSDGVVRTAHPLLASAIYRGSSELDRRSVHLRLARLADTVETRARHLALAGSGPDGAVADALTQAAYSACQHGARSAGAGLYEQAARITPPVEEEARLQRLLGAARAHFESGETARARELLEDIAGAADPVRYDALCDLGTLLDETVGGEASLAVFAEVLLAHEPEVRARAHRGLAQALAYVGDLERALEHADAAVAEASHVDEPAARVYAVALQALVRKMSGRSDWRPPLEEGLELERHLVLPSLDGCPGAFAADTHRLEFALDDAREAYELMLARAAERGDVRTECWCRFGLASVEISSGQWEAAATHAEELGDLAVQTRTLRLPALRTAAHLAMLRGLEQEARAVLSVVCSDSERKGELHNLRGGLQLEGLLELSLGRPEAALAPLRRAREIAECMAVGEPSMLTCLLDEVEAHALCGDAASAAAVLMAFDRRCGGDRAPWAVPLVLRARGLVEAATSDLETACATLEAAIAAEGDLPLPLERARTRLAYGRVLRRLQRRACARGELGDALARFEQLGAGLWAERAREELARIGGRTASADDLTPTEQRIAELVAEGRSNREVAAAMFVTPKTVESTLTRVYRKLGVRSRIELARYVGGLR